VAPTGYVAGERFLAKVGAGLNTAASNPTININALGAKTLKDPTGGSLAFGAALAAGTFPELLYDGTDVRIISLPWKGGTWSPTLAIGGGNGGAWTASGNYFRYGPLVLATGLITWSGGVAGPTGALQIGNLPYPSLFGANGGAPIVEPSGFNFAATGASAVGLQAQMNSGTNSFLLQTFNNNGSGNNPAAPGITNSTTLNFSALYFTSSGF
jgi:hypothetical protein